MVGDEPGRQTSSSTHIGAWSLVFSHPRGVPSTPAALSAVARAGLSQRVVDADLGVPRERVPPARQGSSDMTEV
jgi:hypothetical protein